MIKKIAIPAAAIVAGAVLAVGGHAAFAAGPQVPFRATLSGSAAMTSQTTVSFIGAGTATQMGRITNTGAIVFTGSDASCPNAIANVNTEVLVTNVGDTLTIVSQDVACPTGPGTVHGTGQWHVTGATGRFAGTTGSGTADGGADFNVGTFVMNLTGTLTMPPE
jgi:hypothetical protein